MVVLVPHCAQPVLEARGKLGRGPEPGGVSVVLLEWLRNAVRPPGSGTAPGSGRAARGCYAQRRANTAVSAATTEMMQKRDDATLSNLLGTYMSSLWLGGRCCAQRRTNTAVSAATKEMMQPCLIYLHVIFGSTHLSQYRRIFVSALLHRIPACTPNTCQLTAAAGIIHRACSCRPWPTRVPLAAPAWPFDRPARSSADPST